MTPAAPVGAVGRVSKPAAAAVSIASNAALIGLKLAAAAITGSVAILSEALHSMVDLIASVIAFISVRRADEPADVEHPYGHEKVESLAASIEGMLILVGAGLIVYQAVHRLAAGAEVEQLGVGIAVIGFSALANGCVSLFLRRQAERHSSPALSGDAAHLGTDALTSLGVLLGLALVQITGADAIDSAVAIAVAVVIVIAGVRIMRRSASALVDEAPPAAEMDRIEELVANARSEAPEIVGYHKLRARTSGRRRYIDLHLQFRSGTSLERAHDLAHELRDAIEADLGNAEVLIHTEPESSRHDPSESPTPFRAG
ncbi:MAG TPA: cation diffusion facilitator family transporter [Solirubrobacterales bacterium]|nr:cation diffusion facilitator family transporter [Solirubrobacterales bacterium]